MHTAPQAPSSGLDFLVPTKDDRATALTTGVDGSIYATGDAQGTPWRLASTGSATALDEQANIGNFDSFLSKY